jgi:hypothetical protein
MDSSLDREILLDRMGINLYLQGFQSFLCYRPLSIALSGFQLSTTIQVLD